MTRRVLSVLLVLCLLCAMAGCASMLDGPYEKISDYVENPAETPADTGQTVSNYSELRAKILTLVNAHETSGKIDFNSYDGKDIDTDIGKACDEVKMNTPIGAYAVDYFSRSQLVQFVSYYEVTISVGYRRSQDDVNAIKPLTTVAQLQDTITELLNTGGTSVTAQMNTSIIGEAQMQTYLKQAFFKNPMAAPALPTLTATVYPAVYSATNYNRIFEIKLDYGGMTSEELAQKLEEMRQAVESLVTASGVREQSGYDAILALAQSFVDSCDYSKDAASAPSAYGALCAGDAGRCSADSYGMALAFLALADAVHIPCQAVEGTLNGEDHAWNIVWLKGQWYHLDCSAGIPGDAAALLRGDASMRPNYIWIASADIPACPSDYIVETAQTAESPPAQG